MPPITAVYFISLIKAWLQGTKTRQEILAETADVLPIPDIANADVTNLLAEVARDMNEDFYIDIVTYINYGPDIVPTRAGLIHHLNALLAGHITLTDLIDWATWNLSGQEDDMSAGLFEDYTVEYFCLDFLPAYDDTFSPHMCRKVLGILQAPGHSVIQEKIALTLLVEHELEDFQRFVHEYVQQPYTTAALDQYLLGKFGLDHESFPYMQELSMGQSALLLQKVQLLKV